MRIMITGANGFLGSALRYQLKNSNHIIFFIVRNNKTQQVDIKCDISHTRNLLKLLNQCQPNLIINCAAKVDFSEESNQEQYNTNTLAPGIMASWCACNNAHLIHISGSIVNGNQPTLFNNKSPEIPINNYGKTKLLADQVIRLSQCKYTIIRFGGIFGKNGPSHLGINNAIARTKFNCVPTIAGKGLALRNYIHVQDAAKAIIHCAENGIVGTHYSGSHQSISIAQMMKDICEVYLNGQAPNYKKGEEAIDQITEVSEHLPKTLSFKKSLETYS